MICNDTDNFVNVLSNIKEEKKYIAHNNITLQQRRTSLAEGYPGLSQTSKMKKFEEVNFILDVSMSLGYAPG